MLSINTNLSSLIAQSSLHNSTLSLNEAVERMSTGYKINHAKDNAANYSITTNLTTRIGAYEIAEENASMGLDMLTTASENLSQIESRLRRLRALATQACNGTYGTQSKEAINSEANALVDELNRVLKNTEYNGIKLFTPKETEIEVDPDANIPKVNINDITRLTDVSTDTIITISDEAGLRKLATMVNAGQNTRNRTFKMTNDITLTQKFTPIGWYNSSNDIYRFYGTFDGCGHKIEGLQIEGSKSYVGLFGLTSYATIKNLNLEGAVINSSYSNTGFIAGSINDNSVIENCFVNGTINGTSIQMAGITGWSGGSSIVQNCLVEASITGTTAIAGIIGCCTANTTINNCYFIGNLKGSDSVGGITGQMAESTIKNSTADAIINNSGNNTGGISGMMRKSNLFNCKATGEIIHGYSNGGLVGQDKADNIIQNSYSSVILPTSSSGAISGEFTSVATTVSNSKIINCYADNTCNQFYKTASKTPSIINSYLSSDNLTSASTFSAWTNEVNDIGNPLWIIKEGEKPILDTGYNSNIYDYIKTAISGNIIKEVDENIMTFATRFQVGINSNKNSVLEKSFYFSISDFNKLKNIGLNQENYLSQIDNCIFQISEVQTILGSTQNRLESALDEISTQYENLVSTRSTIRDADIAEVSASYIQQQILQQAAATLLATANQTPSIALQLL